MLEGLGGSASTLPLFAVRAPRTNDFHAGFAANEERRADGRADRAPHRPARACCPISGRPTGPIFAWRVVFALIALIVAKAITLAVPIAYKAVVDLLTGEASRARRSPRSGLAAEPGVPDRRLWRRPGADGAVRAVPRRVVHRGRPERRARARQPHLQPSACAVAALSSRAPHRRLEPRHRARRHRRRHHRAHGRAQLDPDRGRAPDDLRPGRLLFRLDLRGGRAGDRRRSMSASPSGRASGASPSAAT